jgi:hypothetical protein
MSHSFIPILDWYVPFWPSRQELVKTAISLASLVCLVFYSVDDSLCLQTHLLNYLIYKALRHLTLLKNLVWQQQKNSVFF